MALCDQAYKSSLQSLESLAEQFVLKHYFNYAAIMRNMLNFRELRKLKRRNGMQIKKLLSSGETGEKVDPTRSLFFT